MSDYNEIVDGIRAFMAAVDQTRNDEVESLAGEYAKLCREANDRLRRCSDYLRRGMRSEAIHLAEAHPVLLDLVATLDLSEREDWENLCASYDLTRPPRLLMDAAAELNEAYSLEQPIEALLGRHRLLALVRAPLADRVAVLRAIADRDAANPYWEDDLRTYEKARLVEAKAEASAAFKAKDGGRINRLFAELAAPGWRIDVPADLRATVERSALALRNEAAVWQLREMLPGLETAYNAMDFDEANGLVAQWEETAAADGGVPIPTDLGDHVRPVLDWVAEERGRRQTERAFQGSCGQLSQAIDRDATNAELLPLLRTCEAYGMPISEELTRRYETLVDSRELARRRKTRLKVAAIVAVVAVCATGVGLLIRRNIEERKAAQWAKTIGAYVEAKQFDKVNEAWDELGAQAPQFRTRPELVALKVQADDAVAAEQKRRDEFRLHMDAALKADIARPDAAALASAEKVATAAAEKLEVLDLKEKIAAHKRQRQEAVDEDFRGRVKALAESVGSLEADVLSGRLDTVGARLSKAETDSASLALVTGPTANARQGLAPTVTRLGEIRKRFGQTTAEASELGKVLAAQPGDLAAALTSFATKFPDSARSPAFQRAAQDDALWKSVLAFDQLFNGWTSLLVDSAQAVAARQTALEQYASQHPASPFLPAIEEYRGYLTRAAVAFAADGPWKANLRAMMNSPLVRLNQVTMPDGKRYFIAGDGKVGDGTLRAVSVILTNDVSKDRRLSIPPGVTLKPMASPQRAVSDETLQILEAFRGADWEGFGLTVLEPVRKRTDLDPVLAAILCSRIIRSAETGGWGVSPDLIHAAEELEALGADDVAWMDPDDRIAAELRPKADAAIRKLLQGSLLPKYRAEIKTKRDAMFANLAFRTVGTGLLLMEGGKWQLRANSGAGDAVTASAFVSGPAGGARQRVVVAQRRGGAEWVVDPAAAARVPEGSLVFLERPASPISPQGVKAPAAR